MSAVAKQPNRTATASIRKQWTRELNDLIRGLSGGFLFGTPLLYTMEVWWIGATTSPARMLVALAVSFVVVFLLNRTSGFRRTQNIRFIDAFFDSVEAVAIGLTCTALLLLLLREITTLTALDELLGKIVYESVPFSIGVALASQLLSKSSDDDQQAQQQDTLAVTGSERMNATLADIGATMIGALVIALNIAPTDEIPMLAAHMAAPWLLALLVVSILISYAIVFEAGFADEQRRKQQKGICQHPYSETLLSYLVALLSAAFMLWFFQQLDFNDPWQMWLSYTILLGLPATVGGAAGRLTI